MKTKTKLFAVIALASCVTIQMMGQGFIVPNGVRQGNSGNHFDLEVTQDPSDGDYTGFRLNSQGGDAFLFNPVVDEGVRTFLVSANDPISLQPILANDYPELTFPNIYTFANGTPFYLGLYTGNSPRVNGVYSDPLFGWAQLVNIGGTIQFLGGALEYGGGGIYAGTQTIIPVPEPGALALVATGAALWCFSLRRHDGRKG
jgi:hypothetical protein